MITLLTDFGTQDTYVGVMKGVILSINPEARIVDLSHDIEPQDIVQAAYLIKSSYPYFPQGTIHIIVVDPGVGSHRNLIALKASGHFFLAPDNGVLNLILKHDPVEALVQIENREFMLDPVSRTFHGRDIFAPVAAYLSKGTDISELGPIFSLETIVDFPAIEPQANSNGTLTGTVISIDRFGNLITNIEETILTECFPGVSQKSLIIEMNGRLINGVSEFYDSVPKNSGLALIGSGGYLEISVNCGNAQQHYHVGKGESVNIFVKQ